MGPQEQEKEILNVIDGLRKSMAQAEKQLEEIRKPKRVKIKHGDYGHTEGGNKRLFLEVDGQLRGFSSSGVTFDQDEIASYHNSDGYFITGNVFE